MADFAPSAPPMEPQPGDYGWWWNYSQPAYPLEYMAGQPIYHGQRVNLESHQAVQNLREKIYNLVKEIRVFAKEAKGEETSATQPASESFFGETYQPQRVYVTHSLSSLDRLLLHSYRLRPLTVVQYIYNTPAPRTSSVQRAEDKKNKEEEAEKRKRTVATVAGAIITLAAVYFLGKTIGELRQISNNQLYVDDLEKDLENVKTFEESNSNYKVIHADYKQPLKNIVNDASELLRMQKDHANTKKMILTACLVGGVVMAMGGLGLASLITMTAVDGTAMAFGGVTVFGAAVAGMFQCGASSQRQAEISRKAQKILDRIAECA